MGNISWEMMEAAIAADINRSRDSAFRRMAKQNSGTTGAADDPVNHPSYYTDSRIEVLDYILDHKLGFLLGNCVKYISRAGKKYPGNKEKEIEDLKKARFYLNRRIAQLEQEDGTAARTE